MKIAIIGSRNYDDYFELERVVQLVIASVDKEVTTLASGGAKGTDSLAERFANIHDYPFKLFPADWDKLGKGAGHIRNKELSDFVDVVIGFWDGKSTGTKHMLEYSIKNKKVVYVWNYIGKTMHKVV